MSRISLFLGDGEARIHIRPRRFARLAGARVKPVQALI